MEQDTPLAPSRTSWLRQLSPAIPVVMGYLPVGFAYGVLAANAGLSVFMAVLMSLMVYAGSSQLMAVSMIGQGIHPLSIILTTLVVNLRHMLMSASLAPHLRKWRRLQVIAFCFELTDETFAVHSLRFEQEGAAAVPALAVNAISQVAWVTGSLAGAATGSLIQDVRPFALDYALPAMFIALLIFQLKKRLHIWIAVLSAGLSLGLWSLGLRQWNIILAAVIGALVGAGVETWQKRSS
ncbi:MAG TPA: AzlC family ABC transporter permease [Anaerolineaceae bacterium]